MDIEKEIESYRELDESIQKLKLELKNKRNELINKRKECSHIGVCLGVDSLVYQTPISRCLLCGKMLRLEEINHLEKLGLIVYAEEFSQKWYNNELDSNCIHAFDDIQTLFLEISKNDHNEPKEVVNKLNNWFNKDKKHPKQIILRQENK